MSLLVAVTVDAACLIAVPSEDALEAGLRYVDRPVCNFDDASVATACPEAGAGMDAAGSDGSEAAGVIVIAADIAPAVLGTGVAAGVATAGISPTEDIEVSDCS